MKLRRYTPCPVLVHPTLHPDVPALREQGLVCMGPYANDKWYIFHPKPRVEPPWPTPVLAYTPSPRTLREKICEFISKHRSKYGVHSA